MKNNDSLEGLITPSGIVVRKYTRTETRSDYTPYTMEHMEEHNDTGPSGKGSIRKRITMDLGMNEMEDDE